MSHSAANSKLIERRVKKKTERAESHQLNKKMTWAEFKRRVMAYQLPSQADVQTAFRNRKTK